MMIFFYLFAMYTGGFDGPSETAYTVILRACGNEASTWRNGWRAGLAAIYMVLITPYTPGEKKHTVVRNHWC